jgi:quercetin 2,3-dioxygenase
VSGPVTTDETMAVDAEAPDPGSGPDRVAVTPSRATDVGGVPVRRALPRRSLRTVGAWCFVDHFGPVAPDASDAMQVGPHPHIGLQTVTWLLEGEVLHTDSLGSEQPIRPGQLNLMTAGRGVAHAESARAGTGGLHGVQLWIAQPADTRDGPPGFAHHAELPQVEVGALRATVLVGDLGGATSPATTDTPLLGVDVEVGPVRGHLPLDPDHEHAMVVLSGALEVDGTVVEPGVLAHLGTGRDELGLAAAGTEPARGLLIGGQPLGERLLMWWNFVARTRGEVNEARDDWEAGHERYGRIASALSRIPAPSTPWSS